MLTVADCMAALCVAIGQPLSGTSEQQVRTSVYNAWSRLFAVKQDWKWFHRLGTVQMTAAQTTGTITFTESTRRVVLAGATWPANAEDMHIRLVNSWFPIYRRISSTEIELHENQHPATDLAAGTAYHVQKVMYALPVDVGSIVHIVNSSHNIPLLQMNLAETLELSDAFGMFTQPNTYALIANPKFPGRWCLWIPAVVTTDDYLQYLYVQCRPQYVIYREARGTVTLTGGVATFSDAIVRESWEGCVLRISRTQEQPTGAYGDMPVSDVIFNDDMYEMKILEYLTSTTVRVSDGSTTVSSASPYVVSSHVDVRSGAAETLMQRLCEDEYGVRPVGNHTEGITSRRRVITALLDAATEDSVSFRQSNPLIPAWYNMRLRDIVGSVS
jgi:hypothetical protein